MRGTATLVQDGKAVSNWNYTNERQRHEIFMEFKRRSKKLPETEAYITVRPLLNGEKFIKIKKSPRANRGLKMED